VILGNRGPREIARGPNTGQVGTYGPDEKGPVSRPVLSVWQYPDRIRTPATAVPDMTEGGVPLARRPVVPPTGFEPALPP
jgi:hypothetical protein